MRQGSIALAGAFLCAALAAPASAATVYSQDFSGGLNANESVAGLFSVNGGTVGHSGFYNNNEYSYYQLALNLTNVTGSALTFDFRAGMEPHWDRFNVLASTSGTFAPPAGLLTPTTAGFYTDEDDVHHPNLGQIAFAGSTYAGSVAFDLSQFDGQTVSLRFQFGTDSSVTSTGVNIDNVLVTGAIGVVPEPATWAIMIFGFAAVGGAMRRSRGSLTTRVSFA